MLRLQLGGSFKLMAEVVDTATDEEWTSRPHPGANMIGFTPWHAARIMDWAVNDIMRARPELADSAEWSAVKVPGAAFGAGITREAADRVAEVVPRKLLGAYLAALGQDTLAWFDAVSVDELDETVDLRRAGAAKAEYQTKEIWAEIEDLQGVPRWQFLARPCAVHIRVYYGQVTSQLESMRALNSSRA